MGCGVGIVKFFFFTFNLLLCLCGLAVAGVGLFVNLNKDFSGELQEILSKATEDDADAVSLNAFRYTIWAIIALGAFLFCLGFLGCCGASCESTCLLGVFFAIVLIMFLAEIAVIAFFLIYDKQKFKDGFRDTLHKVYKKEPDVMKPLEENFHCCGVIAKDLVSTRCAPGVLNGRTECFPAIWNKLKNYSYYVGIVALALLVTEVLAMIFTCCLCRDIRKTREYAYYY